NIALSETHLFSPSLVNEVRLGYSQLPVSRLQPNAGTMGIPEQFGIQGVPQVQSNGGLGTLFITGLSQLGSNGYLPSIEISDNSQISDNLTKTMGRHSFKVGFEFQRLGSAVAQPPSGRGTWNFSGNYTEVPGTNGGNTGLAQLL